MPLQELSRRKLLTVLGTGALAMGGGAYLHLSYTTSVWVPRPGKIDSSLGSSASPFPSTTKKVESTSSQEASSPIAEATTLPLTPSLELSPILNPRYGIRDDDPDSMYLLPSLGGAWIRIDGHFENPKLQSDVLRSIKEARKYDQRVMLVYNPAREIETARIQDDLDMCNSALLPGDAVEIGCEGDNPTLWRGSIKTYAKFGVTVHRMGSDFIPDILWIMGAMSNNKSGQNSYHDYGEELRALGFDSSRALHAMHTYDHVWDTDRQLAEITKELNPKGIVTTEVGVGPNANVAPINRGTRLIELLDRLNGHSLMNIVHELINANGFGLVNPKTFQPQKNYFMVQEYFHKK